MGLTPEDIRSLIVAFDDSDWAEMSLSVGETTLELSRTGRPPASSMRDAAAGPAEAFTPPSAPAKPSSEPTASPEAQATTPGTGATATTPTAGATDDSDAAASGHAVASPSVGLFWRSPQPGAPPFTEVGQHVEADDTVCIIEVMKLMNHVKAGVAGTVRGVRAENGDTVEHGQTLFVVEPSG